MEIIEIQGSSANKNCNKLEESLGKIPVLSAQTTYNDFFSNYMVPNVPCLIKNCTDRWKSTILWLNDEGNTPDFDYLIGKYGKLKAVTYNCTERYFNSQKTKESTFEDYIHYWKYFNCETAELKYLKDWHLKLLCPDDDFYVVPIYFASDWLNEYHTSCLSDDYRFVYMGVKDTWTPFHADVFSSYSWSANVLGKKKWILFPPGEENYLRDKLNNLPYDVTKITHSRKCFEITQNAGEALFVPSGWYHQVWNLEDTISVNHNWINACNIKNMWCALQNNLKLVEKEIDDCRDMDNFEEHCQVMLDASFGMNFKSFYEFIKFISESRISMIKNNSTRVLFNNYIIGTQHILFDLKVLKVLVKDFVNCDSENTFKYCPGQEDLLRNIENILETN